MGFFSDLFGTSGAATDAANAKIAGLRAGQAYADPRYEQARGAITQGYGQAQDIFNPMGAIGTAGAGAYADITGAAGQAGQDRARALFQTSPGYDWVKKQALDATQRIGGTGGFQNSGNVLAALEDRGAGLASQEWGNYVKNLQPFLPYSLGAGALAGGAYTGEGTQLAGNLTQQGQLGYGTEAGAGSAQAAGILGEAQANQAALGSLLGFGGQLLGYGSRQPNNYGNLFFGGGSPSGYG